MITAQELRTFLNWPAQKGKQVLSVYLNMEPDWDKSAERKFETVFKTLMQKVRKEVPAKDRAALEEDFKSAWRFVSKYEPAGRALVLFADASEGYCWNREMRVHLPNRAEWCEKPFILPLLEAAAENKRYGVVLVNKAQARLFTYFLGEVEEEIDALAGSEVQSKKSPGRDSLRSQFKMERTADMHVQWHLKHVAELLGKIARLKKFDSLVLGGTREAADRFERLLPAALRGKVAGRLALPVHAPEKDVEAALNKLESETKKRSDETLVHQLTQETDPMDSHRLLGVEATLNSLRSAQIRTLVYSDRFGASGRRCGQCGMFAAPEGRICQKCGAQTEALSQVLEGLARRVALRGGRIEAVHAEAAKCLEEAGGIAAILKEKP